MSWTPCTDNSVKLYYWPAGNQAVGHVAWMIDNQFYSIRSSNSLKSYGNFEIPHHRDKGITAQKQIDLCQAQFHNEPKDLGGNPVIIICDNLDKSRMKKHSNFIFSLDYYLLFNDRNIRANLPAKNCVTCSTFLFLSGIPRLQSLWNAEFRKIYGASLPVIKSPQLFHRKAREKVKKEALKTIPYYSLLNSTHQLKVNFISDMIRQEAMRMATIENTNIFVKWERSYDKRKNLITVSDVADMIKLWNQYPPP